MKRILPLLLLLTLSSIVLAQNQAQAVLNPYKDSISHYGTVVLLDDGKKVETGAIGVSHPDVALGPSHTFCMGSCSKMYTATLIFLLQEKGQLSVDDSLHTYLPTTPFIDSTITLRQLLNHTSGIADYTDYGVVNEALFYPFKDYSDTYLLSLLDTVDFVKGERYRYSNTNYLLLRMILERVADRPYEVLVEDFIIQPLGLKNTYTYYSSQMDHLAHPIWRGRDVHDAPKKGTNTISRGDGNLVSDAADLNRFIRALLIDSIVLNEESLNIMTSFMGEKKSRNGCGLFADSIGTKLFWGHTGRQFSYITYAYVNPETGQSFVLWNNDANDQYIDQIAELIGKLD
jgi:D-alanyl-D-alanine carboxypeptidase